MSLTPTPPVLFIDCLNGHWRHLTIRLIIVLPLLCIFLLIVISVWTIIWKLFYQFSSVQKNCDKEYRSISLISSFYPSLHQFSPGFPLVIRGYHPWLLISLCHQWRQLVVFIYILLSSNFVCAVSSIFINLFCCSWHYCCFFLLYLLLLFVWVFFVLAIPHTRRKGSIFTTLSHCLKYSLHLFVNKSSHFLILLLVGQFLNFVTSIVKRRTIFAPFKFDTDFRRYYFR